MTVASTRLQTTSQQHCFGLQKGMTNCDDNKFILLLNYNVLCICAGWFLQFTEIKWNIQCFKLSSVTEKDHLQALCHSRLLTATHCASCVKGIAFRILISEQGKRAVVVFLRTLTTASLWHFLTRCTAETKEEGAAVNNLTGRTVWGSCERLFVCQPRHSQSESVYCQVCAHTKD